MGWVLEVISTVLFSKRIELIGNINRMLTNGRSLYVSNWPETSKKYCILQAK